MSTSLAWFARHEMRLAWRDFVAMMTGGQRRSPRRKIVTIVGVLAFVAFLHLIAESMAAPYARVGAVGLPDKTTLVAATGSGILALLLMLSQAMETTTRAFYARADLDLILSSPASARTVFAVRIGAIALASAAMTVFLGGPFVNVLAYHGGPRWLAAYAAIIGLSAGAAALAVALSVALFRLIGPRRTRIVSQIVAAFVGASFVIGIQVASIVAYGSLSRFPILTSAAVVNWAPGVTSPLYWPARAMLGDLGALLAVLGGGFGLLAAAILLFAPRFGDHALAAGSIGTGTGVARARPFRMVRSPVLALMIKEWRLILRDPWLLSQSLMQILYLLPPALLLWRNFGDGRDGVLIIVPVVVMGAGQLAGGLAWLALSAEDAPDLVASSPISPGLLRRAKVLAVAGAVGVIVGPLILGIAAVSPWAGLVAALGSLGAVAAATAIQLFFRVQARRAQFRRRQTASRMATLIEAFSSIGVAGAAGLATVGSVLAIGPALFVLLLIGLTRLVMRPA